MNVACEFHLKWAAERSVTNRALDLFPVEILSWNGILMQIILGLSRPPVFIPSVHKVPNYEIGRLDLLVYNVTSLVFCKLRIGFGPEKASHCSPTQQKYDKHVSF